MLKSLQPEGDFQSRRFRPNIYIESAQKNDNLDEFDWVGGKLFVGDTVIKCESRTVRCSMPAQPQAGMEKDSKVLRALEKYTQRHLGINATVERPGIIHDGDLVYWQEIDSHPPGRVPEDGALSSLIVSTSRSYRSHGRSISIILVLLYAGTYAIFELIARLVNKVSGNRTVNDAQHPRFLQENATSRSK